jgi:hypothetical protein
MPDMEVTVEQVREAIDFLADGQLLKRMSRHSAIEFAEAVAFVVVAARRWVESQDAPRIWWCEEHNESFYVVDVGNRICWLPSVAKTVHPCRMVERLLVSPSPTKET